LIADTRRPLFPLFFKWKHSFFFLTFFIRTKSSWARPGGQSFIFFSPNLWVNYTQTSYLLYKKASICSFWCRNGRGEKICIFSYIFIIISSCKMICSFFSLINVMQYGGIILCNLYLEEYVKKIVCIQSRLDNIFFLEDGENGFMKAGLILKHFSIKNQMKQYCFYRREQEDFSSQKM